MQSAPCSVTRDSGKLRISHRTSPRSPSATPSHCSFRQPEIEAHPLVSSQFPKAPKLQAAQNRATCARSSATSTC